MGFYSRLGASGTRNAASLTTSEAEKSVPFSPVAQTTHGFQTRNEKSHNFDSLTNTHLSGSGTAASHTANTKTHQRQTSPTTPPRQAIHNDIVHRTSTTYGREKVLFIGTQFSILYTFMYSPAEAATHPSRNGHHSSYTSTGKSYYVTNKKTRPT